MRLYELHKSLKRELRTYCPSSSEIESRSILKDVLNISDKDLLIKYDLEVNERILEKISDVLLRRKNGEPLSRIQGKKEFFESDFKINSSVLDPRPETEILVETAISLINKIQAKSILDLGTGSGCILISLIKLFPKLFGVGLDLSEEAIKNAKENVSINRLEDNINFVTCNWGNSIEAKFDILISNPPYIKTNEIKNLPESVKKYDPLLSLDGGYDGLQPYINIARNAQHLISKNGKILVEIGFDQANKIDKIFYKEGFNLEKKIKDYNDLDRILVFS